MLLSLQDELTMDNISRSGLVNMCRYMGLPPFGNDNFLRFQLRSKLRAITQVNSCGVNEWVLDFRMLKYGGVSFFLVWSARTTLKVFSSILAILRSVGLFGSLTKKNRDKGGEAVKTAQWF